MQSRVDRHRDHHLRQVVAVVLGLAQPTSLAARIVKSTSSSRYGATVGWYVNRGDHRRRSHPAESGYLVAARI